MSGEPRPTSRSVQRHHQITESNASQKSQLKQPVAVTQCKVLSNVRSFLCYKLHSIIHSSVYITIQPIPVVNGDVPKMEAVTILLYSSEKLEDEPEV